MHAAALLLGGRSYAWFAQRWVDRPGEWAERLTNIPKYVVRSSDGRADWGTTTVLSGDIAAEVSNLKRSVEFYQGLFGMPIAARQGPTTILRIGPGPQFLAVSAAAANTTPAINHFCVTVEDFNVDRIVDSIRIALRAPGSPGPGSSPTGRVRRRRGEKPSACGFGALAAPVDSIIPAG